ncbi:MAG: OmpA family protein [Salinivirgaceae bacterium]|nr:OmpA family protein [Salinivirgaceae bacterium]MDY0281102.1 OmpA family protein [Salinivirgaceae bacterium]
MIKNTRLFIIAFLLLLANTLHSQPYNTKNRRAGTAFNQAKEHYSLYMYSRAIVALKDAIQYDPSFIDAHLFLAQIYKDVDSIELQVKVMSDVFAIDPECFPPGYINRAEGYLLLGQYELALFDIEYFNLRYKSFYPKEMDAINRMKKSCEFSIEAIKNPTNINLEPLPPSINTLENEYWPSFTVDNKQFFYTVQLNTDNRRRREDIWTCFVENDVYSIGIPIGQPVNTMDNEGASFISPDGRYVLFTGCNRPDGYGSCDIYMTVKKDGAWLKPRNLGKNVNSPAWESRPVISSDGNKLYFASSRKGGFGKSDIYVSDFMGYDQSGFPIWDVPKNLGAVINTEGDEMAPFIHPDNKTLYFSSDFHTGMGRQDIFKTVLENDVWSAPVNLGYPINSPNSEMGIFVQSNGKTAFIAKETGVTKHIDIYKFQLPKTMQAGLATFVKGIVVDKETKLPLETEVEINDFVSSDVRFSIWSNSSGEFLVALAAGEQYSLTVNKTGYLFYSDHFEIENIEISGYDIYVELEPIKVGSKTVLNNVFFETDSYELSPESQNELQRILRLLKSNPNVIIEIGGHTDNRGSDDHNKKLSQNRSKSVYEYLINQNIDKSRLTYVGYGSSVPVKTNENAAGRAKNRRTEIKIIGN